MFKLDVEKCVKCGLCTSDCITGAIVADENNRPMMVDTNKCIKCEHCFAICPKGAITFNNKKPEDSFNIEKIDDEKLLNLIQSRRSVRKFKNINVNPELIQKLKDMLNYSPTGCNNHKLCFSFIEDIEAMDDFRNKVNYKLLELMNKKPVKFLLGKMNKFSKYKDEFLKGEDVIYRNCPHMLVVSAPIDAPCPVQDGLIALSYFELYANSLGLGTLWCGFSQAVLKMFPEFCEYLEIPDGYTPVYCMLFGYPNVEYKRTIQPESYEFKTVKLKEVKLTVLDNIKRFIFGLIR